MSNGQAFPQSNHVSKMPAGQGQNKAVAAVQPRQRQEQQQQQQQHPQQEQVQQHKEELLLKVGKTQQNGFGLGKMTLSSGEEAEPLPDVKISNIIGDFGPYQIAVVIFAALRALSCAMDGLSGPFLSPNIKNFQCDICDISAAAAPAAAAAISDHQFNANGSSRAGCSIYLGEQVKTRYDLDASQCFFDNPDSLRPDRINCNKWNFNHPDNERLAHSLTIEQSLVCDREWLKSLSNSMYFVGATLGLLFWGIISDRYGRRTAYICSHFVSMIFGFSALFANSMCSYILLRSINSFGMIGELIPRSIQLEVVATEYRFICSVICQIGWATGIILVPALSYFNPDYRFILSIPVAISVLMLPWLLYLPESARWLITSQSYQRARDELVRAARINGKLDDETEGKIERFNRQVIREESISSNGKSRMGIWRSISAIFTNLHLLKDTMSVFILLFVAEVVYFSLTLNVADLGGSLYINYVISGLSELVSIAFCGTLLAYLSRRMCLSLLLLASTVSYLLLSLVNVYEDHLSMTVILTVNAFGKLTAIGNLMVIILVSQEVFPTVIRQFGTSLCITVGKMGSAVAPFTHELGQIIGQSWCFAMFSLICLSCAIIPFVLSETGNRELPDTVIDVEEGADNARRKRRLRKLSASNKKKKAQQQAAAKYVAHYQSTTAQQTGADSNNNNNNNELGENGFAPDDGYAEIKQKMIDDNNNNNNNNNDSGVDNYAPAQRNGPAHGGYDDNNNHNNNNNSDGGAGGITAPDTQHEAGPGREQPGSKRA